MVEIWEIKIQIEEIVKLGAKFENYEKLEFKLEKMWFKVKKIANLGD